MGLNSDRTAPVDLAREPDFALGPAQVRPALCEVAAGGRSARLQRRVMQVLVAMTQAGGEVVSRDEFADRCWGGLAVSEDSLNRCIGQLRRLIDEFAPAFAIETLAGVGYRLARLPTGSQTARTSTRDRPGVAVLPFANMSGDPEQEYFSDGITEDVITDLSKVSSLFVVARHTVFAFKNKTPDLRELARELGVTHVLEGSVRKAGGRVRITAQLVDGETGGHAWADRYDRDLADIFALQDEISQAIVRALKVKLLPEEKEAIERRGTSNPAAYKLYLMARQFYLMGNQRTLPIVARICRKAVELDPGYALAWAQLALVQSTVDLGGGAASEGSGGEAAERAVALAPDLADAHAAKGAQLFSMAQYEDCFAACRAALALDPDCVEASKWSGWASLALHRYPDAITHYERAATLEPGNFRHSGMVLTAYEQLGDLDGARSAARRCIAAVEKVIAIEPDHGTAVGFGAVALAMLGENDRAKEWAERATLLDPDNVNLHYNLACAMTRMNDPEAAITLLEATEHRFSAVAARWMAEDADLDPIRDHPRFKALLARLTAGTGAEAPAGAPPRPQG